jgi:hypothetical protein
MGNEASRSTEEVGGRAGGDWRDSRDIAFGAQDTRSLWVSGRI